MQNETHHPRPSAALAFNDEEESPELDRLIEQAQERPFDGYAQFDLALSLFDSDSPDLALRHLELAFRLQPLTILELIEESGCAEIAARDEVREVLRRFHHEHQERARAGYA